MDNKIRIAYISATSQLGGAEVSLYTLIQGLDRDRFEPVCLLPEKGHLYDRLRELQIEPTILPMETRRRRKPFGFWLSRKRIAQWISNQQPDLVHVNSFWAPELAIPAAVLVGVPVVYHIRDFYDHLDRDRLKVFSQCDRLICITNCVAEAVRRINKELPLEVIYNTVDIDYFKNAEPVSDIRMKEGWQNAFIVGVSSRLSPEKGQETFLKAAELVRLYCPSARFLIVGGSQFTLKAGFEEDIQNCVSHMGLSDSICFTGFVQNMPAYYKTMDVCVLASDWEPFGRTVIEAMASGTPVVATRSGGPEEVIEDGINGLLVPPSNPEALAEALLNIYSDELFRRKLSDNGIKTVRARFGIEQARNFEALYKRIIQERSAL